MPEPTVAGYVLAGGRSLRMGTDKALISWEGETLLSRVAETVKAAAGSVHIVGRTVRGYACVPDLEPGIGPVGGVAAALEHAATDLALIVACDMPGLNAAWLRILIDSASGEVTVPLTSDGRAHPLCAVWRPYVAGQVAAATKGGIRRLHDVLGLLDARYVELPGARQSLLNLNTPGDLAAWQASH